MLTKEQYSDLVTKRGAFLDAYQTWFNGMSNCPLVIRWDGSTRTIDYEIDIYALGRAVYVSYPPIGPSPGFGSPIRDHSMDCHLVVDQGASGPTEVHSLPGLMHMSIIIIKPRN